MLHITLRNIVALSACALPSVAWCNISANKKEFDKAVYQVSDRLKLCLKEENLRLVKKTKDEVKIYTLRDHRKWENGLPVVRVAVADIHAPIDEVAAMWNDQAGRKSWDIYNCNDSQVVRTVNNDVKLTYILTLPGYVVPARDFVHYTCRVPGGIIGLQNFMSIVFLNIDAATELPMTPSAVRGRLNSALVLEPKNAETTRATYIVEASANGWIPSFVFDFSANSLVRTLSMLKAELEAAESEEEKAATVEEAARLRFQRHQRQKEKQGETIVNDVTATAEDLKETLALLEAKLKDVKKMESANGLDMSELKQRISKDIAKTKSRLSSLK